MLVVLRTDANRDSLDLPLLLQMKLKSQVYMMSSSPSLPPPDEGSGVVPAVSSRGAAAGMSQSPGGGGAALKNNDCNYAYLNQDIKRWREKGSFWF